MAVGMIASNTSTYVIGVENGEMFTVIVYNVDIYTKYFSFILLGRYDLLKMFEAKEKMVVVLVICFYLTVKFNKTLTFDLI